MNSPDSPGSFSYVAGVLSCGSVSMVDIAAELDTPTYVYSAALLRHAVQAFHSAAQRLNGQCTICYSLKANGNPALLRLLANLDLGADIVSGGELFLAQTAGFEPKNIVFSGVGKSQREIEEALQAGILALHVESRAELDLVAQCAQNLGLAARIAVRVNPDIRVDTHAHMATGSKGHKFGVSAELALALMRAAASIQWLQPVGLSVHLGSQIASLAPYRRAAENLGELADALLESGLRLQYIDMGGGLAIDYSTGRLPDIQSWLRNLAEPILARGYRLLVEPGRAIVGPAGLLLCQVRYLKDHDGRQIAVTDAGMNDLLRPALYGARHPIIPVKLPDSFDDQSKKLFDVVGPVCETADVLATDCALSGLSRGDLLAVLMSGAYGYSMSSNYNGRLRPAEALVEGKAFRCIRRREGYDALLSGTSKVRVDT